MTLSLRPVSWLPRSTAAPAPPPVSQPAASPPVAGIARIEGVSYHLPEAQRSSAEIERRIRAASPGVHFPPGVVEIITGIRTRHVAPDHEQASDLAAHAARDVLARSEFDPRDVDALIFASASQDMVEPATANMVQEKVGTHCPVFDVKNACNSFICGLQVAEGLIATGTHRHVLVTVGELPSRAVKWALKDRDDLRLSFPGYTFGDAGAAALVGPARGGRGIFYRSFRTESRFWDIGTLAGGGSAHPRGDEFTYFRGDGSRLRDAFVALGPGVLEDALTATGTTLDDYARVLVHQVTMPFLKVFLRQSGVPREKLVLTLPEIGNVAAATMPIQLAMAIERGDVHPGDRVAWIGLAGGISIGVMLMEV